MIYFDAAPLEGVTDYVYRAVHHRFFPETDRYYTPFIAANWTRHLKKKEEMEVTPELNSGVILVPQILTDDPEVLLYTVRMMRGLGYRTVNLNLGCPSVTVTRHGKGAAQLADPDRLDAFFETYFEHAAEYGVDDVKLTVKTRIGMHSAREAGRLIRIYNRYPVAEVIVHARTGKAFYGGSADLDAFSEFAALCVRPLLYNGDVVDLPSFRHICERFPDLCGVMAGRGLVTNPALIRMLKGGRLLSCEELRCFHDELLEERLRTGEGFQSASGKMKELWYYMGHMFPHAEDALGRIRAAQDLAEYRTAVEHLFQTRKPDPFAKFYATN